MSSHTGHAPNQCSRVTEIRRPSSQLHSNYACHFDGTHFSFTAGIVLTVSQHKIITGHQPWHTKRDLTRNSLTQASANGSLITHPEIIPSFSETSIISKIHRERLQPCRPYAGGVLRLREPLDLRINVAGKKTGDSLIEENPFKPIAIILQLPWRLPFLLLLDVTRCRFLLNFTSNEMNGIKFQCD